MNQGVYCVDKWSLYIIIALCNTKCAMVQDSCAKIYYAHLIDATGMYLHICS